MGTPRDTVYSRGKGINKQKTNKHIKCVCLVKSAVYDVGQQGVLGIVQIEDKQQNDAKCLQSYTRCITQAFSERQPFGWVLAQKLSHTTKTAHHLDALFCWWGQQGSSTAKRKCLHFEASVQCDRGHRAHGVRKGGETALFEPDVVSRHIKKAQHIMLRVF